MTTEAKWKRFALEHVLSDHGEIMPEALFDLIQTTEEVDLEELFDEYDVVVWRPFADMPLIDVACFIVDLGTRAQWVANND